MTRKRALQAIGFPQRNTSVYDRVMSTQKIRAAWRTYPPAAMKDTTTGKMSRVFVETLERVAKNLSDQIGRPIQVEWMPGETPWGEQIAGLDGDRYNIVGSPV